MEKTIAGSIALLLWKLLEFYGHQPEQAFRELDVSRSKLEQSDTRLSYAIYDEMWRIAESLINEPGAGLTVANFWHPGTFGALGYAMLSSSTLRISLERLVRFQKAEAQESDIVLLEEAESLLVKNANERHQNNQNPLLVDVALSTWLHICRFNYGDIFDPVEVSLMREKPVNPGRYFAYFRCPVVFGAPSNHIRLPLAALDKPLAAANKQLAQLHDRVLQRYLDEQTRGEVSAKVRESIIQHLPSGDVSKEVVASELCMSSRTLQRKLEDEGKTYNDVLNDTRRELALRYIQEDSLPLTEVSFLLGFSDSAAFSRAFKRWTGKTPSESKASLSA